MTKISTQLDEKNNYKPDDLSKNNEVEIQELKNKQTAKNELSKPIRPSEKKPKKSIIKNQLEKTQKSKLIQAPKNPDKKNTES